MDKLITLIFMLKSIFEQLKLIESKNWGYCKRGDFFNAKKTFLFAWPKFLLFTSLNG